MQNVKILSAVLFGVIGFWVFSLVGEVEATHIMISETAAHPTYSGSLAVTFRIDAMGAADRIVSVSSPEGEARLMGADPGGMPIPVGTARLTLEAGHIHVDATGALEAGAMVPLRLMLESAGSVSARVRVVDTTAEATAARISRFEAGVAAQDAPSVALKAEPDGDGWRVSVAVTGQLDGHALLYAGGVELGRVSDPVVRIGALPRGEVELRVVLIGPDGAPLWGPDGMIEDRLLVSVQ